MTELEAKFGVVTPLFMSGADLHKAELRVPSIKGDLRFWWRALALGRLGSVENVRNEEARIFGSAGGEGQSRVHLRLSQSNNYDFFKKDDILKYSGSGEVAGSGARYLGYGLMNASGKLGRSAFNCNFDLGILFKPKTEKEDVKNVVAALIAMGLFGGLGSRSRRGYGSLNLLELKNDGAKVFEQPKDGEDLKLNIQELFEHFDIKAYSDLPPYTAYSTGTRIDILNLGENPLRLLNSVGEALMMYRSYGRNGKVNGKNAERNFDDDHDMVSQAITEKINTHPRRVVFGLPHNYHFSNTGVNVGVKPQKYERRASPLFLHIQSLENGQYATVASIFPAKFLPEGKQIEIQAKTRGEMRDPPKSLVRVGVDDFQVINGFFDGKDGQGRARFPESVQVIGPRTRKGMVQ